MNIDATLSKLSFHLTLFYVVPSLFGLVWAGWEVSSLVHELLKPESIILSALTILVVPLVIFLLAVNGLLCWCLFAKFYYPKELSVWCEKNNHRNQFEQFACKISR